MVAERNLDENAFVMTFDDGHGDFSKLTCFNIDDENKCVVLGEYDGEITAFIDPIPDDDDD